MQWDILYEVIVFPIIFILPAYVANGAPVIFGGGKPLDLGKKYLGKRIFGDHKTIRGTIAGIASGFVISLIEAQFISFMLATGIMLTLGTHFGDLLGSFIKRRAGKKEGSAFLFFDQYLFLIFALLFAYPLGNFPNIYGLIFLFALTGVMHALTNRLAYMAKLKKVPW